MEKNDDDDGFMVLTGCIGLTIGIFVLGFVAIIVNAFTVCCMWNWFVAPYFGIDIILTMVPAYLLIMFVEFVHPTSKNVVQKPNGENYSGNELISRAISYLFLRPLVAVGITYILTTYFM